MNFSWDPEKDAANRRKHKISFRVAVDVFADPTPSAKYFQIG